jgi:hypothetical protein
MRCREAGLEIRRPRLGEYCPLPMLAMEPPRASCLLDLTYRGLDCSSEARIATPITTGSTISRIAPSVIASPSTMKAITAMMSVRPANSLAVALNHQHASLPTSFLPRMATAPLGKDWK